jgi:hypothetical protein
MERKMVEIEETGLTFETELTWAALERPGGMSGSR